jgi:UDP-glucose 4-epimerase
MKILVTGATGFVGRAVAAHLRAADHRVVAAVRRPGRPDAIETRPVGDIDGDTDWSAALADIDAVVHLAARAHVMTETETDPLAVFRRINRDGALALARQMAESGPKRLIFLSSVKVNGEATPADRPFRADDPPAPADPYGLAKAEAEEGLRTIAESGGLALTILRPPLVHGPGARGNLAMLMRALDRRLPLPLGAIRNRRSLVGVDNLADAVRFCLNHPETAGRTYMIRDGEDVSTPELIWRLGRLMGRPALLLPVPPALLRLGGRLVGRRAAVARLTGSLAVDDRPLRDAGWTPPLDLERGLAAMTAPFRKYFE